MRMAMATVRRQLPSPIPSRIVGVPLLTRQNAFQRGFGIIHICPLVAVQKTGYIPSGEADAPRASIGVYDELVRFIKSRVIDAHGIVKKTLSR
jgi:hypothetical protein